MPTLLVIEVGLRFDHSISRKLTAVYIEASRSGNPGGMVVVRDSQKPTFHSSIWPGSKEHFTPAETHSPFADCAEAVLSIVRRAYGQFRKMAMPTASNLATCAEASR
jgi:hypothetical protein